MTLPSQKPTKGRMRKGIFVNIPLMMPRKGFDILEQDMTQTIYENYLGILGVSEI